VSEQIGEAGAEIVNVLYNRKISPQDGELLLGTIIGWSLAKREAAPEDAVLAIKAMMAGHLMEAVPCDCPPGTCKLKDSQSGDFRPHDGRPIRC
jgi:hypothetical protein